MDFNKTENFPILGGRGVYFGDNWIKKLPKIDVFISLCNNSEHKIAGKLKIQRILKNYMLSVGTE